MSKMDLSLRHPSLSRGPANFIGGRWIPLPAPTAKTPHGALVESRNPAHPDHAVWTGVATPDAVALAVRAARAAMPAWAKWGRDNRFRVLRRFADLCKQHQSRMAELICDETGKVMWEAKGEASALASKVEITLDPSPIGGLSRVNGFEFEMGGQKVARCWFKPHGVMAVLGPFNFPAHLPNGHIVPALAMGNTVVFKPSEKTPGVGQLLVELFDEALRLEKAPNDGAGVINLVQGGAEVSSTLANHDDVDGILFTGSWPVGRRILDANLERPGRIVALELGGSNPAVVMHDADLRQAVIEVVRCAFNTSGQRCTATRRVIVHERVADRFIAAVANAARALVVNDPRRVTGNAGASTGPFMGPVINDAARQAVMDFQKRAIAAGSEALLAATLPDNLGAGHYVTPGILRVREFTRSVFDPKLSSFDPGCDHEVFGPLLRVSVVKDLDEAIRQANATRYGLAASIFTSDQAAAERFLFESRAGCVNVNTGTAGASSKLPFGGLGLSGNHRPAGSFSLDYCAYPVAGMIERGQAAQLAEGMTWSDSWL